MILLVMWPNKQRHLFIIRKVTRLTLVLLQEFVNSLYKTFACTISVRSCFCVDVRSRQMLCCRLSAFVAKCFHEAKDYIAVDEEKIARTLVWIIEHQSDNGAFQEPPEGRVIHTNMQVQFELSDVYIESL